MKKILLFGVKIYLALTLACIFAGIADSISCYHLAGISGFLFGGVGSYMFFDSLF